MMTSRAALISVGCAAIGYGAFRWAGRFDLMPGAQAGEGVAKILLWVVPGVFAAWWIHGGSFGGALRELGLWRGALGGYAFGLLASVPILAILPAVGRVPLGWTDLVGSVLLGPFAEEVLFRGLLFRQLTRAARWPPLTAMLVSGLAFGLAHYGNVEITSPGVRLVVLGQAGTTAIAGVLLAWIVFRFDSLWPAIGLHAFLNLSWALTGGRDWTHAVHPGAGPLGNDAVSVARVASLALAVLLTLRQPRARRRS